MGKEQIIERMKEIKGLLESEEEIDVDALDTELRELEDSFDKIEKREAIASKIKAGDYQERMIENIDDGNGAPEDVRETKEYRSAFLKSLLGKNLSEVEQRAFTSSDSSAGVAIPTGTANVLFSKMVKIAPMLEEITLLRVAGNVKFAVEGTRNKATLHTENESVTPAEDTLTEVSLAGYELIKVLRISKTVQTMSINAFEGWLIDMLAEDIAEKAEDYIINGTGSSQPKGAANAATYVDGTNAVEYANGGKITYDEVNEAISYLPARYDKKAKLLCNKKFVYQQLTLIKDDNKNPILVKDMANGLSFNIMGYPIIISDKVADGEAYLGDFTKIVGNLAQDVTVESSTQSGFLSNAIDFRGTAIFDCDIALTDAFIKISEAEAA